VSRIEWTERTWNPTRGCSRVSPGCDNCYAMHQARRFDHPGKISGNGVAPQRQGKPGPYHGLTRIGKRGVDWSGVVRLEPELLGRPLRWQKPARIFVNSMSDLFHEALSNEQIAAVFGVMAACPQHTFQVLTKRAERMKQWFEWYRGAHRSGASTYAAVLEALELVPVCNGWHLGSDRVKRAIEDTPWPLPNVWLGVSTEDQQRADERIPHLLATPAAVRFVSAEPLLAPIDLSFYLRTLPRILCGGSYANADAPQNPARIGERARNMAATLGTDYELSAPDELRLRVLGLLDWVIIGGESGSRARACEVEQMRAIVRQCREAHVACFVKQLGSKPFEPDEVLDEIARDASHNPENPADIAAIAAASAFRRLRLRNRKGGDMAEWPADLRVREYPARLP
jgi:protein gp37